MVLFVFPRLILIRICKHSISVINIFKQKNPVNIILLAVAGILLKLPAFLHPHVPIAQTNDGILFQEILNFLAYYGKSFHEIYPILAFIFLFIQSVALTLFVNNQRMMSRPNYLPGISYMLITSFFPEWNYFSEHLIINTFLLYILSTLFKTYNQSNAGAKIYNAGLVLGIAVFIFFPSIVFALWIFFALMIMRPFRINEWLLCILGITTPFYFFAVYLFLTNQFKWQSLTFYFSIGFPVVRQSAWLAGSAFLIAIPFLVGGYHVQNNLNRMLINVRKGWSLLLLYLLVAIIIPFINPGDTLENWIMVTVPFAAFHAFAYFYSENKLIPRLTFWLSIAFVIAYQYFGPGW